MPFPYTSLRRHHQQGATLVVTMVILVLITMLGTAAMLASDTQLKLTGNIQFEDVALNRAEAALAAAESWLASHSEDAGFTHYNPATPQIYPVGQLAGMAAPNNSVLDMVWSDSNSLAVVPGDDTQRYLIEQVSLHVRPPGSSSVVGDRATTACNAVNTYLVTARGTAARGASKWVQSYYAVPGC